MSEKTLSYQEQRRLRKAGLLPALPTKKEKKPLKKKSPKTLAREKQQRMEQTTDKKEDDYYEYWMEHAEPVCAECGMTAYWLLEPQEDEKKRESYRLMWRACQAHLLPKKKEYGFPSLRNNLDNHIVLFPAWGGHLCGDHGFYDSSWFNASTMKIWPEVKQIIIEKLIPLVSEKEKKNIPEILLKELK
jgi:hypothetical protein